MGHRGPSSSWSASAREMFRGLPGLRTLAVAVLLSLVALGGRDAAAVPVILEIGAGLPEFISPDGVWVGGSSVGGAPFRWSAETNVEVFTALPSGQVRAIPRAITDDGEVFGWTSSGGLGVAGASATYWSDPTSVFKLPSTLGGTERLSMAMAASADGGIVAGTLAGTNGAFGTTGTHGVWERDAGDAWTFTPFAQGGSGVEAMSSDGDFIVGTAAGPTQAARWVRQADGSYLRELLGALYPEEEGAPVSTAVDVSDGGTVVGESRVASLDGTTTEAYISPLGGAMVGLGVLPGAPSSRATGIANDGSVVIGRSGNQSFIWSASRGIEEFNSYLLSQGAALTGWSGFGITDIQGDAGSGYRIVGTGTPLNGASRGVIIYLDGTVAVPEPSALALSGVAAAVAGLARRARRRGRSG